MPVPSFFIVATLVTAFAYKRGGPLFFIAAFPGTLAHELAHYLTALVLRGNPHPIDLVPRRTDSGWVLGSVTFHPTWWNGALVALAPLLLLPVCWMVADGAVHADWGSQLWLGYLAGCCACSCLPSRADWNIVARYPVGFLVLLLVALLVWHLA